MQTNSSITKVRRSDCYRARFFQVAYDEVKWLMNLPLPKSNVPRYPGFDRIPSLVGFLGFEPDRGQENWAPSKLLDLSFHPEDLDLLERFSFKRNSSEFYTIYNLQRCFGDHLLNQTCNPVYHSRVYRFLAHPLMKYSFHETALRLCRSINSLKFIVGSTPALQPVCISDKIWTPEMFSATCSMHRELLEAADENANINEMSRLVLWKKNSPLGPAPQCICLPNILDRFTCASSHLTHQELLSRLSENPGICETCIGLTFVPFSMIEITLNVEISNLSQLITKVPLPLESIVYSGAPFLTAVVNIRDLNEQVLVSSLLKHFDLDFRVFGMCCQRIVEYVAGGAKSGNQFRRPYCMFRCVDYPLIDVSQHPLVLDHLNHLESAQQHRLEVRGIQLELAVVRTIYYAARCYASHV